MDFGEWFHLTKYAHSSCHSLPLNLRRSNPGGYPAEACSRQAEGFFFWWADLVELVQHTLMLAFSCFCSGWHFLCAPGELLALNGCLTFQTQCIARCLARRRCRAAQGARAKRFAIAHGPAYSTQYSIMCFVNFRHVSAHFIAFTTWCKAATIQGTVLQFAGMPAVKQSVSFWQLQGWNYWKGTIPRTWRLQTGLGGHNLDCGNI